MKKIIALMLVLIMALSMAACGSSESADPGVPAQPDTPELNMPTVDPTESETPAEQEPSGDRSMGEILMGEFLN